jgi:hypothetical protein
VLDRSLDLLKQRSHELFRRDLALGDTHCSAGLHELHIGDANEAQDVPKIGDFIVVGFQAGSCVITSSASYRDNNLAALRKSLRSRRNVVKSFSSSYDVVDPRLVIVECLAPVCGDRIDEVETRKCQKGRIQKP